MKNNKLLLTLLMASSSSLTYAQATCSTIDCIALALIPQVTGVMEALMVLSYILGIVFGIKGVLKLKEHSESKGQVKINIAFIMIIASACFISLPSLINIGVETMQLDTAGAKKFGNY